MRCILLLPLVYSQCICLLLGTLLRKELVLVLLLLLLLLLLYQLRMHILHVDIVHSNHAVCAPTSIWHRWLVCN